MICPFPINDDVIRPEPGDWQILPDLSLIAFTASGRWVAREKAGQWFLSFTQNNRPGTHSGQMWRGREEMSAIQLSLLEKMIG